MTVVDRNDGFGSGESGADLQRRRPTISVVSATYNCVGQLPNLVDSLLRQTDLDFEWVVADGGSADGTVQLLRNVSGLNLRYVSQPDFGVYDGLNRAIKAASGDFYIVAGADDRFEPDAIANFRTALGADDVDIVVANAICERRLIKVKRAPVWIVGEKAFIAQHSVATAFRKRLHEQFGWYSRKFPIGADSLFVLQACEGGARRREANFVAGVLGAEGVSCHDWAGAATELFRVQLLTGRAIVPQTLLLLLRFLKGANKQVRSLHHRMFRPVHDVRVGAQKSSRSGE